MKYKIQYHHELTDVLQAAAQKPELLDSFLHDLLTPQEYKELAIRWQIVSLLQSGITQREIAAKLGVGIATVTRGARELQRPNNVFSKLWQIRTKNKR